MDYIIFKSISLKLIVLQTIFHWFSVGAKQLHNYIDFSSGQFPADRDKAILITNKNNIFVEINSFDQRFRIIATLIDSKQEKQIYLGRIYLKHDSHVIGYVKGNAFLGVIKVNGMTYNLETITKSDENYLDQKDRVVMYRDDSVLFDGISDSVFRLYSSPNRLKSRKKFRNRLFAQQVNQLPKNRVCGLDIYADIYYTKAFGTLGAVSEMLITVREVNAIFSRIDFDGDGLPDNIGVSAVKWTVADSMDDNLGLNNETDGEKLLRKFQKRLTDHCIQVLFTHRNLQYGNSKITGLANLKGVCYKQSIIKGVLQSPNSLLVSSLTDNRLVNRVQRIIDLTHEIGHSFGAQHDNEYFEGNEICNPSALNGGPFIMSTIHGKTGYQVSDLRNKQKFSSCSKRVIKRVLSDSERNQCFIIKPKPKCGDLEVNYGEECDAGSEQISRFADPCCEPTGSVLQCQTKRGIQCHPKEGSCCDVKTCQYLHWKVFAEQCRIDCWEPAMCLGTSAKCPVRTALNVGSICWNCSSDDCICDKNGICRNRHNIYPTTTALPITYSPPKSDSIHRIRRIVFLVLYFVSFVAFITFCWISGLFDYIWNHLRRYRLLNRVINEPIVRYEALDSDHEHRL